MTVRLTPAYCNCDGKFGTVQAVSAPGRIALLHNIGHYSSIGYRPINMRLSEAKEPFDVLSQYVKKSPEILFSSDCYSMTYGQCFRATNISVLVSIWFCPARSIEMSELEHKLIVDGTNAWCKVRDLSVVLNLNCQL